MNTPRPLPGYTEQLFALQGAGQRQKRNAIVAELWRLHEFTEEQHLLCIQYRDQLRNESFSLFQARDVESGLRLFIRSLVPVLQMMEKYDEHQLHMAMDSIVHGIVPSGRNLAYVRYIFEQISLGVYHTEIQELIEQFFAYIPRIPKLADSIVYTRDEVKQAAWVVMEEKKDVY